MVGEVSVQFLNPNLWGEDNGDLGLSHRSARSFVALVTHGSRRSRCERCDVNLWSCARRADHNNLAARLRRNQTQCGIGRDIHRDRDLAIRRPQRARRLRIRYRQHRCVGEHVSRLAAVIRDTNDVDPIAYLKDVLLRVDDHPASQIDDLLPHDWTPPRIIPVEN